MPSEELEVVDTSFEIAVAEANREYDAVIDEDKSDSELLDELALLQRKQEAELIETRRRIRELERARFDRRAVIKEKDRAKNEAEQKQAERIRFIELEKEKANAFLEMVRYCRDSGFDWVDRALPHQWEGALTVAHYERVILGDGTGTGKTLTAIMSMDMMKAKKVLVITPADVVSGFADELLLWAPHRNILPLESANPAMRKLANMVATTSTEFTFVTNYEAIWNDHTWLSGIEWDAIYIDEVHNMKNEKSLTYTQLKDFTYKAIVPMTATSILNVPQDIWTSLNLIDDLHFHDIYFFLTAYCMQDSAGKWIFREGGEKQLIKDLQGRIIQRSLADCGITLPTQHVQEVLIPRSSVPEDQATIMKQLSDFAAIALEDGSSTSVQAMIALITRERQAAVYPAGIEVKVTEKMYEEDPTLPPVGTVIFKVPEDTSSIKLDMAEVRLEQVFKAGKRSVVFSQFKGALKDLQARLEKRGMRVARYDGDTPKHERLSIKRDFIRPANGGHVPDYKYDVVLANYKTGGVGLTFTEATYMLCPDEEWNPARNQQARARIHRIGQTEETYVDIMRIEKSIDMWMKTINEHKKRIIEGFESEVNIIESLKEYFAAPAVETPIERVAISPIDDEDLSFLDA